MEWLEITISVLIGIVICIPLIIKLYKFFANVVKNKDWQKLLDLVMKLMADAEKELPDGASRKEWVLKVVESSAEFVECDINLEEISSLIDNLCTLTKMVNAAKK